MQYKCVFRDAKQKQTNKAKPWTFLVGRNLHHWSDFLPGAGTESPVSGPQQTLVCRRPWSHSSSASAGTGTGLWQGLWSLAFCNPIESHTEIYSKSHWLVYLFFYQGWINDFLQIYLALNLGASDLEWLAPQTWSVLLFFLIFFVPFLIPIMGVDSCHFESSSDLNPSLFLFLFKINH